MGCIQSTEIRYIVMRHTKDSFMVVSPFLPRDQAIEMANILAFNITGDEDNVFHISSCYPLRPALNPPENAIHTVCSMVPSRQGEVVWFTVLPVQPATE